MTNKMQKVLDDYRSKIQSERIHFAPDIPEKKMKKLKKKLPKSIETEKIQAFMDTSLYGGGGTGLVLTDKSICGILDDRPVYQLGQINEIKEVGTRIEVNGEKVADIEHHRGEPLDLFLEMIKQTCTYVRQAQGEGITERTCYLCEQENVAGDVFIFNTMSESKAREHLEDSYGVDHRYEVIRTSEYEVTRSYGNPQTFGVGICDTCLTDLKNNMGRSLFSEAKMVLIRTWLFFSAFFLSATFFVLLFLKWDYFKSVLDPPVWLGLSMILGAILLFVGFFGGVLQVVLEVLGKETEHADLRIAAAAIRDCQPSDYFRLAVRVLTKHANSHILEDDYHVEAAIGAFGVFPQKRYRSLIGKEILPPKFITRSNGHQLFNLLEHAPVAIDFMDALEKNDNSFKFPWDGKLSHESSKEFRKLARLN